MPNYRRKRHALVAPHMRIAHHIQFVTLREMAKLLKISPITLKQWQLRELVPPGSTDPQTQEEYDERDEISAFPERWTRAQVKAQWNWIHLVPPSKRRARWWTDEDPIEEVEGGDLISCL